MHVVTTALNIPGPVAAEGAAAPDFVGEGAGGLR